MSVVWIRGTPLARTGLAHGQKFNSSSPSIFNRASSSQAYNKYLHHWERCPNEQTTPLATESIRKNWPSMNYPCTWIGWLWDLGGILEDNSRVKEVKRLSPEFAWKPLSRIGQTFLMRYEKCNSSWAENHTPEFDASILNNDAALKTAAIARKCFEGRSWRPTNSSNGFDWAGRIWYLRLHKWKVRHDYWKSSGGNSLKKEKC